MENQNILKSKVAVAYSVRFMLLCAPLKVFHCHAHNLHERQYCIYALYYFIFYILYYYSIFNIALSVTFQTPSSVQVPCFLDTYPIFCIGSKHDITTRYIWDLFGSDNIFPDSPVLYAKQPGLYQCTVIHYIIYYIIL